MFAKKNKIDELPEDAVVITKEQALAHQMDFIQTWDRFSEVWPLRSGVGILSVAASLAGLYINGHYRRKLKLRRIGIYSTYIPIVVLPGMIAAVTHKLYITTGIILEEIKCPVCLQVKSATIQTLIGFLYPMVLAPLGNFMYATRHATYRLPDVTTDYFGWVRLSIKLLRPIGTQLSVILIGQILISSYFPYLEAKAYYKVKNKMIELEKEYDNSLINNGI